VLDVYHDLLLVTEGRWTDLFILQVKYGKAHVYTRMTLIWLLYETNNKIR